MRIGNVFWAESAFSSEAELAQPPSILAIGDSWFWYPLPGGSLLTQLGKLVASAEHNILALGKNGAEAYEYAFGRYEKAVRRALKFHGDSLMGVFISGGGNDFAGFNDLRPLLKNNCAKAPDAASCFNPQPTGELYRLMDKIATAYQTLIGRVMEGARNGVKIYLHNYDYSLPTGKGVFGGASWLKAALDDAQVPDDLQAPCIAHVLDEFTGRLEAIASRHPGQIYLVDGRGCLSEQDWANELHPTAAGFRKLAEKRWLPLLKLGALAK